MVPRKIRQSPKLPAEKRREQLLGSARRLFTKNGYRETTTEQIALSAGLTKGALYHHFKSKENILFELVKEVTERHFARLDEVLGRAKAPARVLDILLEQSESHSQCSLRDNVDFWIQAMRVPRIKRYLNRRFREMVDRFAGSVDTRYGNKTQRNHLAVFTFSLFHGLRIRNVLDPRVVSLPAQIKLYGELLDSKFGRIASGKGRK
ncbi:MAG: TetR/AcrR family transcriptional regulator [Candidatus Zixiibacteriota bacterium]|nr:MAG: TetR/AcrR family transcriptional regulator [candidate division Zixibacteria bacterium]